MSSSSARRRVSCARTSPNPCPGRDRRGRGRSDSEGGVAGRQKQAVAKGRIGIARLGAIGEIAMRVPWIVTMDVRRIRPVEWRDLRRVRLRALATDPDAFGSTYADEAAKGDEWWQEWARDHAAGDRDFTAVAWRGTPVGIAAGFVNSEAARTVTVFAMWVAPEARRGGVGTALLAAVEEWASVGGAERLRLSVIDVNPDAVRFYEACGYTRTGITTPLARDASVGEIELAKGCRGKN